MHNICFSEATGHRHILPGLLGAFWSVAWTLCRATQQSHVGPQTRSMARWNCTRARETRGVPLLNNPGQSTRTTLSEVSAPKGCPDPDLGEAHKTSRAHSRRGCLPRFYTLGVLLALPQFCSMADYSSFGHSVNLHRAPSHCAARWHDA